MGLYRINSLKESRKFVPHDSTNQSLHVGFVAHIFGELARQVVERSNHCWNRQCLAHGKNTEVKH